MTSRLLRKATLSQAARLWARTQVRYESQPAPLAPALRDKYYPKIGNRDIVGFGWNGHPTYMDLPEFPAPAVRFRENTAEVLALREKEKGDWNKLTLDEKKALYRASFCQTYAEMLAPTGEWKSILAGILLGFAVSFSFLLYIRTFVVMPLPKTITPEWQRKQLELMIKQRQNPMEGVASHWDYENNRWK